MRQRAQVTEDRSLDPPEPYVRGQWVKVHNTVGLFKVMAGGSDGSVSLWGPKGPRARSRNVMPDRVRPATKAEMRKADVTWPT